MIIDSKPSQQTTNIKTKKKLKEEVKQNTSSKDNNNLVVGRPFYDDHNGTGLCTKCKGVWKLEQQIMHTTKNKTRTYGSCPICKNKRPLRKTPRTRNAWLRK